MKSAFADGEPRLFLATFVIRVASAAPRTIGTKMRMLAYLHETGVAPAFAFVVDFQDA